PVLPADPKGVAGRDASGKVLNVLAQNIPWFLGGSADLAPSNKTTLKYEGGGSFQSGGPSGKNRPFGTPRRQTRQRGNTRAREASSPGARAARTCTSASASTRWRQSSTASRYRRCGRSARPSSSSATMIARPSGGRR